MPTINNTYGRKATADMIASAAIVFVRKARAEGYTNKLDRLTIDGMAQGLGIDPKRWTWSTVVKTVRANAALMGETDLLDLDPTPAAEPIEAVEAPAESAVIDAPTYANVRRYLGRRFQLNRMATGRRSGQRWTEGAQVRATTLGIVVDYRESSGSRAAGAVRQSALPELRAYLGERWTVSGHPYQPGALIVSARRADRGPEESSPTTITVHKIGVGAYDVDTPSGTYQLRNCPVDTSDDFMKGFRAGPRWMLTSPGEYSADSEFATKRDAVAYIRTIQQEQADQAAEKETPVTTCATHPSVTDTRGTHAEALPVPACEPGVTYGIWNDEDGGFVHTRDCALRAADDAAEFLTENADGEYRILAVCREHEDQPADGCEDCNTEEDE